MGIMNFFKKTPSSWKDLSNKDQKRIASKIATHINNLARYKIVSGFDQTQRERGIVEVQNEDNILSQYGRGRMLNLTRNAVRNSSTFNTILKQFDFNVCGTKAGKAIFNFDDIELNHFLKAIFTKYSRNVDFFDGMDLNSVLKLIMKTQLICGDVVVLFDDGVIEDSGKLVIFEGDEIGNTTPEAIKSHYGEGATQSLGKVYNANGRWIGTVVSRSERGKETFDPNYCYFLKRDPNLSNLDNLWVQVSNTYRPAQGRGITQASSSLATILDLEDLTGFELQAAKKNSQTFAQIIHCSKESDVAVPSAFDEDTDFSNMTDEQIEEAAKSEATIPEQTISFQKAMSAGIIYEAMPDDYKMELLNTNHPNENVKDMVVWLAGRSSAVFGLSEAYATLMVDGNNFRANQLITQPAFEEMQKTLERNICDWVMVRFLNWCDKKGVIELAKLGDDYMKFISWAWPKLDELDEEKHQKAIQLKLQNCTTTLAKELGPDWRETMNQLKEEIEWCKQNNIPHPSLAMKSGGERSESLEYYNK